VAQSVCDVTFIGPEVSFDVRNARIQSAISAPFSIQIVADSEQDDMDLDALVGSDAKVAIAARGTLTGAQSLEWSGVCNAAELVTVESLGHATYSLTIVPRLWLLTLRRNYRIFQRLNALDIVTTILDQWGVTHAETDVNAGALAKLDYRVQHGESDFAFVSRMLEEAGISYTWHWSDAGSQMFLTDRPERADRTGPPIPFRPVLTSDEPHVWHLQRATSARYGSIAMRDYDFRKPSVMVSGEVTADTSDSPTQPSEVERELYEYAPGQSVVVGDADGGYPVADQGGAASSAAAAFAALAKRRLEGQRVSRKRVHFTTNVVDVAPGIVTAITDHARTDLGADKKLLVISTVLEGDEAGGYRVSAQAVFANAPFHPQPVTPRPTAPGLVTARVVGPSGQEIYTDEFGRVRVQFPWDRLGQYDEHSSCWIRVSQSWAGTGHGTIHIPRIGQEVLVGFLGGDPDQPVIVGRLYNATQQVPYGLPDAKHFSGWKSNSTPGSGGFNELRFEDAADQELIFLQAQKDMQTLVKNDHLERSDHDRKIYVKNNLTKSVDVDETESTGGDRVTHVTGDNRTQIQGDQSNKVGGGVTKSTQGDLNESIGGASKSLVMGNRNATVGGADKLAVSGKMSVQAGEVALKAGGNVKIKGTNIGLNADTGLALEATWISLKGAGGFLTVDESGITMEGVIVKINSGGAARRGGPAQPDAPDAPSNAGDVASPEQLQKLKTSSGGATDPGASPNPAPANQPTPDASPGPGAQPAPGPQSPAKPGGGDPTPGAGSGAV
jgi:type VI secretion system secreted protein VgrG